MKFDDSADCRDHGCCMYGENSHPQLKDLEQGVEIRTPGPDFVSGCGVAGPASRVFEQTMGDGVNLSAGRLPFDPGPDWTKGFARQMDWQPGVFPSTIKDNPYPVVTVSPPNVQWGDPYIPGELHSPGVPPFVPTPDDYDQLNALPAPEAAGRPGWSDYFMGLAFLVSQRSPDQSTKHGCVIVDPRNNHVVGMGYNGFPRGMKDEDLPQSRPEKYAWFVHAEENAIANTTVNLWDIPSGAVAYVTGQCCFSCSRHLVQNNIRTWVMAERRGFSVPNPADADNFDRLVRETGVCILRTTPNLDWLISPSFLKDLRSQGFLSS